MPYRYIENPSEATGWVKLPYMGRYKAQRVVKHITYWGREIEVSLWKSPRCIVGGGDFEWIAEPNRWISVVIKPIGKNVTLHLSGDTLNEAMNKAKLYIDRRSK